MKTISINLYQFDELSEEAQKKAIQKLQYINVEHDWWDVNYDDAAQIGLKIKGFDIGRGESVDAEFMDDAEDVAQKIIENHGECCETHQTAKLFLDSISNLNDDREENEDSEYDDRLHNLEGIFLKHLKRNYLTILREDYEYKLSKEAVIETIECNDYDFREDGTLH